MSFDYWLGLFIDNSLLCKGPFAFEVEAVEERVARTIHSQADIEDIVEPDGIAEPTDKKVPDEV